MPEKFKVAARDNTDLLGLLALLFVLLVAYQHYDSSLLTPASVTILSAQFLPRILAAAGQTTVMLLGGIDLSLGAVLGLSMAVFAIYDPQGTGGVLVAM